MWGAILIREARLRAGLTQQQLADLSGRKRSVIARWERGRDRAEPRDLPRDHRRLRLRPAARARPAGRRLLANDSGRTRVSRPSAGFNEAQVTAQPLRLIRTRSSPHWNVGARLRSHRRPSPGSPTEPRRRPTSSNRPVDAWSTTLIGSQLALADVGARAARSTVAQRRETLSFAACGRVRKSRRVGSIGRTRARRNTRRLRRPPTRGSARADRRGAYASPSHRIADLARMLAALGRESDLPKLFALRRLQALKRRARLSSSDARARNSEPLLTPIAGGTQMHFHKCGPRTPTSRPATRRA